MTDHPTTDAELRELFKAITRVRDRYPDAEAAGVPAIETWHIYATVECTGGQGTASVGSGPTSFAAWIDAAHRIGGTP